MRLVVICLLLAGRIAVHGETDEKKDESISADQTETSLNLTTMTTESAILQATDTETTIDTTTPSARDQSDARIGSDSKANKTSDPHENNHLGSDVPNKTPKGDGSTDDNSKHGAKPMERDGEPTSTNVVNADVIDNSTAVDVGRSGGSGVNATEIVNDTSSQTDSPSEMVTVDANATVSSTVSSNISVIVNTTSAPQENQTTDTQTMHPTASTNNTNEDITTAAEDINAVTSADLNREVTTARFSEVTTSNRTAVVTPVVRQNSSTTTPPSTSQSTSQSANDSYVTTAVSSNTDEVSTEKVRDNDTKDKKTPPTEQTTSSSPTRTSSTAEGPLDESTKSSSSRSTGSTGSTESTSFTKSSTVSVNAAGDTEEKNHSQKLALGILIPALIVFSVVILLLAYRKLKKKGRGYITLDDLGNFQGMNNPNYDPEL